MALHWIHRHPGLRHVGALVAVGIGALLAIVAIVLSASGCLAQAILPALLGSALLEISVRQRIRRRRA